MIQIEPQQAIFIFGSPTIAPPQSDDLLTITEAAKAMGVSVPTTKRWIKAGWLPAYHLGPRLVRIRRSDLNELLTPVPSNGATPARERPAVEKPRTSPPIEIPRMTDQERAQALEAIRAADEFRKKVLAERGGKPFPP